MLVGAILTNGLATDANIGAGLGPGPRDGLMTGLARRGHSLRLVQDPARGVGPRPGVGLGGSVGIGILAYAPAIGPLVHFFLPRLTLPAPATPPPTEQGTP